MTAIVGIINRNGAALAADSAATHTLSADNKKKITNHANKVFELSKYHPVGVAICGGLSILGVPWEDLFKLYRHQLEKGSFPHIIDYVGDFMRFVKETVVNRFPEQQKQILHLLCAGLRDEIINISVASLKEKKEETAPIKSGELFPVICAKLNEFIGIYTDEKMKNGKDFEGYSIDSFKEYAHNTISEVISGLCAEENCPEGFYDLFTEALFHILISRIHVYLSTTEIIFWGYGEDDLFPTCHSIKISAVFDNRIKWSDNSDYVVSNTSPSWIIPYAQTDVANTVVMGVDAVLRTKYSSEAKAVLEKFKGDIVTKLEETNAPKEFIDVLSSFDLEPYTDLYTKNMNLFIQQNYIDKLMDTVSNLMKEDLADMAESLVRMTCLKRHFTTDEETVGGPVDVAVATRGDGFVWIKRKHYFDAGINHHYFER